jgi:serine/threonine protein phosphatase PrpC
MTQAHNRVVATVLSHRGARRPHNEDSVIAGSAGFPGLDSATPYQLGWSLTGSAVVAIADGLGGESAGEVASAHAVRRLQQLADQLDGAPALEQAIAQISAEIWAAGRADDTQRGMATTVVGLLLTPEATWWGNVGDSALLKLEGGYVGRLHVDDSPRIPHGEPGADVIATPLVTQVLGNPPSTPLVPHTGQDALDGTQTYLLCSDGLTTVVTDEQIERVLAEHAGNDAQAVWTLWATAMNAGGPDNITMALVRRYDGRLDGRS